MAAPTTHFPYRTTTFRLLNRFIMETLWNIKLVSKVESGAPSPAKHGIDP
jgi:hypothetical protein